MSMKKLLALVLALTMVLSVSAAAAYTVAPYGDAEQVNEDCEVAVQTLYSMDIMKGDDKGNFRPEATITRAEVAKMIYVILNYGDDDKAVNYTGAKIFSDVKAGEWYEGYVNYMAMTKLVQGRPDGTFGPNDPVTTAEAAKMLLTAIGYSAENRGYVGAGWDKQVLADASMIGLLSGYNYSTTGYAPRQWVAVMFYNALTEAYTYSTIAPVVFNGLLTGTNYGYEYVKLGEKYYNMADFSGIVMANEYANLVDGKDSLSAGKSNIGDITGLKVTTTLDDLGEEREGHYNTKTKVVYYIGDTGNNNTFSTGASTKIYDDYIDDLDLIAGTKYFLNFESSTVIKKNYVTDNGEWLKVIDNNDDGDVDYVFVTTFEMTEVASIAKNGTVTLENDVASKYFKMSEEVAVGDVVIYTKIDDNQFVDIADSFEGQAEKYTFRTDVLTVDGEDYGQSGIDYTALGYKLEIKNAERKTDYVFYQDHFGYIRFFAEPVGADGELVLLTNAYYQTGREGNTAAVIAYLGDELIDTDVSTSIYTDYTDFIDTDVNYNSWDRLKVYAPDEQTGATTNLARYTMDDDGVMSLYDVTTYVMNKDGTPSTTVKTGYVNLLNQQTVEAGQTTYLAPQDVKVQATKDTVYYYVSQYDDEVMTVVGYKNSYDVPAQCEVKAMYAVATNVSGDAVGAKYPVADVIVVETKYPVFNMANNIVLGYNLVNRTVSDFGYLEIVTAEGQLDDLNVTYFNGSLKYEPSFTQDRITVPTFYYNTEDAEGNTHLRTLENGFDYAAHNIYAVRVDREIALGDYFVITGDNAMSFYYDESVIVYDLTKDGLSYDITDVDDYDDALTIETGCNYILVTDADKNVIYAIQVESYTDAAAGLYADVKGNASDLDALGQAKDTAIEVLTAWAAEVETAMGLTKGALDATLAEQVAAVKACTTEDAIAKIIAATRADVKLDGTQTGATAIYNKGAELKAAQDLANATYTLTVENNSERGVVINNKAYELAKDSVTELKAGDVLTLTSGVNVTVSGTGDVEVVMGADMQHWTITVKGNGTIRISLAN